MPINVIAGLMIAVANRSWAAVGLACLVWPLIFCSYVSIVHRRRAVGTIESFRLRGRRFLLGSPVLTFYAIEFSTALFTVTTVAVVGFLLKTLLHR